jgi:NAD(P)H-hydrate epimerase
MSRLLRTKHSANDFSFLEESQKYVDQTKRVTILKGGPTFVLSPNELPILIPRGDPGMATAGSGDVLTGILAALLAQKQPLLEAAVLAVTLHALAGEAAAAAKTSYGYSASDLIAFLPEALRMIEKI